MGRLQILLPAWQAFLFLINATFHQQHRPHTLPRGTALDVFHYEPAEVRFIDVLGAAADHLSPQRITGAAFQIARCLRWMRL